MLLGFHLLAGSITIEMVSSGNHRSPEGREKGMANIPKVSAAGRSLWGTPTLTCAQSASTSGSAGSLSSRSEHATAATPASESTFVRHLNHLDINGEEVGSLQGAIVAKRKKRGSRAITGEKSGRGLRQFSMKVCEKVESKGATTYNEVADELVAEFADPNNNLTSPDQQQYDEKNIRRRVYDALNVLMAMDIISKDKKEIQWKGLPRTSLNDIEELKVEAASLKSKIERKTAYLHELEDQAVLEAFQLLRKFLSQFRAVEMQTDSMTTVLTVRKLIANAPVVGPFAEIIRCASDLDALTITHVYREGNEPADWVARAACRNDFVWDSGTSYPKPLIKLMLLDYMFDPP